MIIVINIDRRVQFIQKKCILTTRIEYKVTWTRTCFNSDFRMFVQFPKLEIYVINDKLIHPQVDGNCKTVGWVRNNTMCMWSCLPLRMNAGTDMQYHIGRRFQTSVGLNRKHSNAPAFVVGNQSKASRFFNANVARILST